MEWRRMGAAYCVRLHQGDELIQSLTSFAREVGLSTGSVGGIGAVLDVELGFYHLESRTYERRSFPEEHELVNLSGNFSLVDGEPFLHAHATISGPDYVAHAGHLFGAKVAVTGEFIVLPLEGSIERRHDEAVGLNLWSLTGV